MIKSPYIVTVFAALATLGWAGDQVVIVESFQDGLNSSAFSTPVGRWSPSVTKSKADGLTATKSVYNDATTDTGEGTARFTPDVPVEGKYELFITYPASGNAKGVIHKIVSAEGEKQVILDQNGRTAGAPYPADTWHSLGVFTFAQGTAGYVEVSDPLTGEGAFSGEPNKRIYADAIRLVPQGFELPADYVNKPGEGTTGDVAARTGTFLPAVGAPATTAAASSTAPPAQPPAALPSLPDAAASAAPALPNLPSSTASTPSALPSLPGAAAVATGPAPTPATSSQVALPSLPSASPADSAAGLPALPTSTAASGAVAQLPSLPAQAPSQPGLPSLPSVTGATPSAADAVAALPRLPEEGTKQTADAATALPALPANTNATPSTSIPAVPPLPGLPSASATPAAAEAALPSLPSTTEATPDAVAALPGLPGLPTAATPTPARTLPSVNDTPAAGYVAPLPPVMAAAPFTAPPPLSSAPSATAPASFGIPPTVPSAPAAPAASPAGWSLTADNPANLQWTYDFGAALNMATQSSKKVMVFFTAKGNRTAARYENEYFSSPSVRALLDQFVLVKVDFPRNTKLAYSMGVFGAGTIAITDHTGRVLAEIDQIPSSAQALAVRLQNPTAPEATPAPAVGAPVTTPDVPPAASPAFSPADPATAGAPPAIPPPTDPAAAPPPPGDTAAGLPALPPG